MTQTYLKHFSGSCACVFLKFSRYRQIQEASLSAGMALSPGPVGIVADALTSPGLPGGGKVLQDDVLGALGGEDWSLKLGVFNGVPSGKPT